MVQLTSAPCRFKYTGMTDVAISYAAVAAATAVSRRRKQIRPSRATKVLPADLQARYFVLAHGAVVGIERTSPATLSTLHAAHNKMAASASSHSSASGSTSSNASDAGSPPVNTTPGIGNGNGNGNGEGGGAHASAVGTPAPHSSAAATTASTAASSETSDGAEAVAPDSQDDDGLNAKERTFVAANKIPLRQFLKLRDGVLREYEKRSGKLERKTATRIYRNESQKAGRVYDFLAENGQITAS